MLSSEDALSEVRKQIQHNRNAWDKDHEEMPVFGTMASKFNDVGVTALYQLMDLQSARKMR